MCHPPKFSGRNRETFIIEFENCARANRWGSDDKLSYLLSSLQRDAAYTCKTPYNTYGELVSILAENYAELSTQEQIMCELQNLRQKPDQQIRDYKMAIMRCFWKLDIEHQIPCNPKNCFVNGLYNLSVRAYVKQNKPIDIHQAMELAMTQENIIKENEQILAQRPTHARPKPELRARHRSNHRLSITTQTQRTGKKNTSTT